MSVAEAGPVDAPRGGPRLHVRELEIDRRDRDGANRKIHVEAGTPRPLIGQPAAERRTEDRRDAPHGREQADISAAFGRGEDVADDREEEADHHAGANPLQSAKENQLSHAVERHERQRAGGAAQRRCDDKQDRAEQEERLAPVNVGQAREDRHRERRRQEIHRGHPRIAIEAGQRRDDARFCRADDRLIDGGEERRQHQADERADQLRPREAHEPGGSEFLGGRVLLDLGYLERRRHLGTIYFPFLIAVTCPVTPRP